jgi:hypothetical protein
LNKAAGEDGIPYEFWNNATDILLKDLCKVFNKILTEEKVEECFNKSIIFPIHKKGDTNIPSNYRGISFMNSVAKIFIGIMNIRLTKWVEDNNIIKENQAGFRKGFSTIDNIYSLCTIAHLKMKDKKKLYSFFVDFKAAFDKVPRQLLFYKLDVIGVSTKIINIIKSMYASTMAAVWTGENLSNYFETKSGVKQGCLLSPLLFALYLNDLDDCLRGGVRIHNCNIKSLMYADDIVLLATDSKVLQNMIFSLEEYCKQWGMEVNLAKSEIMVFRRGGRLSGDEKWTYNREEVRIVSEYCYLGFVLTPKLSFVKHIGKRNIAAKSSINSVWKEFLMKRNISMSSKWKLFQAVGRAIQTYGAQVWGFTNFEEVDKLQSYFFKRILRLPTTTPNYAIDIETQIEKSHFFTLELHLKYIRKTLFEYNNNRLPHQLSLIILREKLFWAKELNEIANRYNINFGPEESMLDWNNKCADILLILKRTSIEESKSKAITSTNRFYKYLNHSIGNSYFNTYDQKYIHWIFKARCDLIILNGNQFGRENRNCTLCNLNENETIVHFLGICPILKEFRFKFFGKLILNNEEVINYLNGKNNNNWNRLVGYIISALDYRKQLVEEFN